MIVLVFVVCLAAEPDSCRKARPEFEAPYRTVGACLAGAQTAAIRWQDRHPAWAVRRWTCGGPTA
jgi:hypothetical protein